MSPATRTRIAALLFLLSSGVPTLTAQEADDATRRALAREEWYNEGYGRNRGGRPQQLRSGGYWSPEFRRFMMEAAARERQKWGALIPGTGESAPTSAPGDRVEAGGGAGWLNIGPTKADYIFNGVTLNVTDSGRVRSFATHPQNPNILYVAFSGGGVWKTVNNGATWVAMTDGLGSLSTGWLAMDPGNPNTLYLGLGDPFDGTGIGLVKSVNGGTTWSAPVFLGNSTIINQVMVSPASSSVVLAATNMGLFRSTDAGASFTLVPIATGLPVAPYVWSIASSGGNFVLSLEADFAAGATGQIWTSADNGATWTRAGIVEAPGGVERITVASAPSSPNIVYAMATNTTGNLTDIFRSNTSGTFFRRLRATEKQFTNPNANVSSPSSPQFFNTQGWYDQMLIVDPVDPNHFFFGGALNTAESTGAGKRYRLVSEWLGRFNLPYVHADAHAAAYDAAGNLYFGTDGGIFKTENNGATFSDAYNIGITSHLIYHLGSSTINRAVVVGGFQDNGTRLRDASTTTYNQTIGGDGFGCDIKASDPTQMLGTVQFLSMRKSTNGGLTFSSACGGGLPCGSGPFISRVVPWLGSATGDVVFTHSNTHVYRTNDYAALWTATNQVTISGALRNIGVAQSNANVLGAVASAGRTFLSTNGGTSWTEFPASALPNNGLSLSWIWFDRGDPNIIYVASVAPDAAAGHLWKSTNFGTNWSRIDGGGLPTGVPVNVVKTDPANPNIVYAGTHLGVYRSDDAGATWVRFGAGMPLVEVTDVYISADNSLMRASTFGRGFWEMVP